MRGWTIAFYRPGDEQGLALRPDMASAFVAEGGVVPPGPSWTVRDGEGRVVGIGGLERRARFIGLAWLLVIDGLTARHWSMGRRAIREVLRWAAGRGFTRIHALPADDHGGAVRLLAGLGFRPDGRDADGKINMTLEIS